MTAHDPTLGSVLFDPPLVRGALLRRHQRFLVDVRLADGRIVVAHCTNTGSLRGCLTEGAPVLIAPAAGAGRRLLWTWKLVRVGKAWVGVDTALAVPLVEEALTRGLLPELSGYGRRIREVPYGVEGRSRIDLLLSRGGRPAPRRGSRRVLFDGDERVYVEVKNTTLAVREGRASYAAFPDAVTERGLKHLHELVHVRRAGHRAAMVYCAQRSDVTRFAPADDIDPAYGTALREAIAQGVEAYALATNTGPRRIHAARRLPLVL